jgi:hypothetical protein
MYDYKTQRPYVFTEEGQIAFLKIRDNANILLKKAGAVRCQELMMVGTYDTWDMLACIDRLVEIRELLEVPNPHSHAGQHRIFINGRTMD